MSCENCKALTKNLSATHKKLNRVLEKCGKYWKLNLKRKEYARQTDKFIKYLKKENRTSTEELRLFFKHSRSGGLR